MDEKAKLNIQKGAPNDDKNTMDATEATATESEASSPRSEASSPSKPSLRIFCIGKIHQGKKTMIIAFPKERRIKHATIDEH